MNRRSALLSAFIALCGLFLFACTIGSSESPAPTSAPVATEPPISQTPGPEEAMRPAIPETRRLILEYPPRVRAGNESNLISLTLDVDNLGKITPTAHFPGNITEGGVIEIPNLYETHNVTAEAQFDIAGLEVKPGGVTFQPLRQGEAITFYWSLRAQEIGTYRGTIWLYLNFEDRSSGEKSRVAVSAQIVEIEAVDFFGFSTNFVRTSGVVGSVLGLIVGFPFFDDGVKYLWGRLARRKRKTGRPPRKM